ncbi:MAG: hypothetical protein QOK44_3982 [Betaproteobacteria bacterium]|jgi:hypothetical protein|nr:hypothetical protein [Betaproteobacteria bacterium]
MKRAIVLGACFSLGALAVVTAQYAASQPRVTMTRQIQALGASGSNQALGAWMVDLQANTVIFCERVSSGIHCHTTALP